MLKFKSYNLKQELINVLNSKEIFEPTEIQKQVFSLINSKKNVIAVAPTGTGKTFSYLIPLLNNLNTEVEGLQVAILLPTKELARQVYGEVQHFSQKDNNIKTALLIGDQKTESNYAKIVNGKVNVVICTISKFESLINKKIKLDNFKSLVLDEADLLIDYGFLPTMNNIYKKINSNNLQKLAFSSSLHESLANSLKKYFGNTEVIMTNKNIWDHSLINHNIVYQKDNSKPKETLYKLIELKNMYLCIIFANTKKDVEEIYKYLLSKNYNACVLHKDLTTRKRKNIYKDIKSNKFQYLVASDLLSRGIDIDGVSDVISYDMPKEDIWYLHRAGRCGRKKYIGNSYIIYHNNYDQKISGLNKKGINFSHLFINNDTITDKKLFIKKTRPIIHTEKTKSDISKIYNKKNTKVKPGYKKKIKNQVKKLKNKEKRAYIDNKMKKRG